MSPKPGSTRMANGARDRGRPGSHSWNRAVNGSHSKTADLFSAQREALNASCAAFQTWLAVDGARAGASSASNDGCRLADLMRSGLELLRLKVEVEALPAQQLLVGPLLHDPAPLQHTDEVGP